ncbi:MAG TPA: hypothetical protein VLV76_05860 [Candidatus Acidoferrum sp.]|nr:hypothetical protein [Candidatus Acidoferrum sp.]
MTAHELASASPERARRLLLALGGSLLVQLGYQPEDRSTGRRALWQLRRNGVLEWADVRTTRDRWFACTRGDDGGWPALAGVDKVLVIATDGRHRPREVQLYAFPAHKVRERLDAAYEARQAAGIKTGGGFSLWIGLDPTESERPTRVGCGLGAEHPPIARRPLDDALPLAPDAASGPGSRRTIAEVKAAAAREIADIAGVSPESVRIEVRILE